MNSIVKKIVAVAVFAAAFTLSSSVFASDRFPLPHEILGIPTPHELLGIPAPHEFILGPDRFSRYNRDDRRYERPHYRSYERYEWRDDRDARYRHDHDRGRHWHHH